MNDMTPQRRLTPEMSSFRALVLAFVRDYITEFEISPSQGEIINGVHGATRWRVRDAISALVKEGRLIKVRGYRGLRLPSAHEEALRVLQDQGYTIEEAPGRVTAPDGDSNQRPNSSLLPPAALTYPKRTKGG